MSTRSEVIAAALEEVIGQVAETVESAGRPPGSVRILLATKTVEPVRIGQALAAGASLIGENRIQEALSKQAELKPLIAAAGHPVEQHFIGHLQSNKIKDMLSYATMLHSLDRPGLARKLQTALERIAGPPAASEPPAAPWPPAASTQPAGAAARAG